MGNWKLSDWETGNRKVTPHRSDSRDTIDSDFLLFEIPPILLVDEYQVEVIPRAELLVDVSERWGEFEPAQEETDGDGLPPDGGAVHDLELGDGLGLVVLVRRGPGGLPTYDGEFHVLDLDPDEEEVDLADDDVFEVVSAA